MPHNTRTISCTFFWDYQTMMKYWEIIPPEGKEVSMYYTRIRARGVHVIMIEYYEYIL